MFCLIILLDDILPINESEQNKMPEKYIYKDKIQMGKKFGLTHGIEANSSDLKKEIEKIVGNKGPEIVFDTTCNAKIMEQAYELTPSDGKTIFVGVPNEKI